MRGGKCRSYGRMLQKSHPSDKSAQVADHREIDNVIGQDLMQPDRDTRYVKSLGKVKFRMDGSKFESHLRQGIEAHEDEKTDDVKKVIKDMIYERTNQG